MLLVGLMWSAYQYLLLVYSGTTPGLKLAKLELHRFDGSPVPLRTTPLARADIRALRIVARLGICLVLPRRRPPLLARSHHPNLHGAQEAVGLTRIGPDALVRAAERSSPTGLKPQSKAAELTGQFGWIVWRGRPARVSGCSASHAYVPPQPRARCPRDSRRDAGATENLRQAGEGSRPYVGRFVC